MKISKEFKSIEAGFSIPELIITMAFLGILLMLTLLNPFFVRKYSSDKQALVISDILQEARQRALTQRETIRIEFNETNRSVSLIEENKPDTADDDKIIKTLLLSKEVIVGKHPENVTVTNVPKSTSAIPEISFSPSKYPTSLNNQTFTLRFTKTGEVLDKGKDSIGSGALMTGATIYVYELTDENTKPTIIRALTVNGVSALVTILKCRLNEAGLCVEWVN